jgi:hypothetical protein
MRRGNPENDKLAPAGAASVGNRVQPRHGLPSLAAAFAILSLATEPFVSAGQLALFVSLVLATLSTVEVVTVRHGTSARHRRALGRDFRR